MFCSLLVDILGCSHSPHHLVNCLHVDSLLTTSGKTGWFSPQGDLPTRDRVRAMPVTSHCWAQMHKKKEIKDRFAVQFHTRLVVLIAFLGCHRSASRVFSSYCLFSVFYGKRNASRAFVCNRSLSWFLAAVKFAVYEVLLKWNSMLISLVLFLSKTKSNIE